MHRLLVLCVAFVLTGAAWSQGSVRWKRISLEQGLSQTFIYDMLQGRRGFMWFGTEDGLNRYDGQKFQVYRHSTKNPNSISDNQINALAEDSKGDLWVGTNHGLNRWVREEERFELVKPRGWEQLSSIQVLEVFCSSRDQIWLTHEEGFGRYDIRSGDYKNYSREDYDIPAFGSNVADVFVEDGSGRVWLASEDSGAVVFTEKGPMAVHQEAKGDFELPSNRIWDVEIGPDGQPWFATSGGLAHYTEDGFEIFRTDTGRIRLPHHDLNSLAFDKEGRLWLSMHLQGLVRINLETGGMDHFREEHGTLPTDVVDELHVAANGGLWIQTLDGEDMTIIRYDGKRFEGCSYNPLDPHSVCENSGVKVLIGKYGEIWLGSQGGGVGFYNPRLENFAHVRRLEGMSGVLSDNFIRTLFKDSWGRIWVGCPNGLNMQAWDGTGFRHYKSVPSVESSLPSSVVNEIYEDSKGRLWIGTDKGIALYNPRTDDFTRMPLQTEEDDPSLYVNTFFLSQEGGLWVSYGLNNMAQYDDSTGSWELLDGFDFLDEANISELLWTRSGQLVVCTYGDGLFIREKDGSHRQYEYTFGKSNVLSNDYVNDVVEDENGVLWLATGNGFNRFDLKTEVFKHFMMEDGLPNQVIYNLEMDKSGRIWMSSNGGISCFDPADESFTNYDVSDGLQSKEFNGGAAFRHEDGTMFFGGINGFNFFHPDRLEETSPPPVLNLTGITINGSVAGESRDVLDHDWERNMPSIVLEPEEHSFSIYFTGIDYLNPDGVTYRYRMKGQDKDWTSLGNQRHLDFNHLAHGDYVVQIQALNGDGVGSRIVEVNVRILPRFYEAGWFKGLVVFFVFLFTSIFFVVRNRKIRRQRSKLEALVQERTQEVRDRMEEVQEQKELVEKKNQEVLDSIQYAKRLQDAILPSPKLVERALEQSFILFKPRDIVAGDFYWMKNLNGEIWYAAADCTGHGVPGAMVSVVCANALNRAFNEFGLRNPGEILDKVRELVVETYAASEHQVKDGMDVALVRLDTKLMQLEYAGAHNPLWIVRGEQDVPDTRRLEEIKADKQPVGQFDHSKPFSSHVVQLHKGDSVYVFSDGFVDQFGGPKGKKYKAANFKKLLLDIRPESMVRQKEIMDEVFEEWRGENEQLDDVCVIGVRV